MLNTSVGRGVTFPETYMQRFETIAMSESNSSLAIEALRKLIALHALTPEKPLPTERELVVEFGMGRRAIRRALSVLEAEGQIWRRQGRGTFIGPTPPSAVSFARLSSRSNFSEVMEARLYLEPALASLAAMRASGEQIAMLRRLLTQMTEHQQDADQIELWDSALHRCIAEAAGNRLLLDLFEMIDAIRLDPVWRDLRDRARSAEKLRGYDHDHQAVVDAIEARAPAEAAARMRSHLRALQSALNQTIEQTMDESL